MSINTNNNCRTKIADLADKNAIEDGNLIIVEDAYDTKKSTVSDLKKAFSGDSYNPSKFRFYSSKYTDQLINSLALSIGMKADKKDISELKSRIAAIISSSGDGNKDTEIVDARNGLSTLAERLDYDRKISDQRYMKTVKRKISGNPVYIPGNDSVNITIEGQVDESQTGTLTIESANILNLNLGVRNTIGIDSVGKQYTAISVNNNSITFKYKSKVPGPYPENPCDIEIDMYTDTPVVRPAGTYRLMSNPIFSENFGEEAKRYTGISVKYSDGTMESFAYGFNSKVTFTAKKGFTQLVIFVERASLKNNSSVTLSNIMLLPMSVSIPKTYIPYVMERRTVKIGSYLSDYDNNSCTYSCDIPDSKVTIEYGDLGVSATYLYDKLVELEKLINNKLDRCGMITDYGTYQYLDNMYIHSQEDCVKITDSEDKYYRNGVPSKKITISDNADRNSIMRIPLDTSLEIIENFGVFFYMDVTDYSLFAEKTGGLKIRLCSDDIRNSATVNYYEYLIRKNEMVQGWNFIKKRFTEDFESVGNPDPNDIKYIYFEICRTDEMNGRSVYLNSFVFNQKMKPAVLLCLNGTYDTSQSYLYPYLRSKGIKPTIFLNAKRTLTAEEVDGLLKYKLECGWDIGLDGIHPNKEILLNDNNYRNQYVSLLGSAEWLKNTMANSPIAFSSPFGNLRPITVPILKDLGFKMAKVESKGYCGFFSDEDFAIPSHIISNETTLDDIEDMIDYAIESNQTVVLYTNDVTEYGNVDHSKKVLFESVIEYILDKVNNGSMECLTFTEFYNKCIN